MPIAILAALLVSLPAHAQTAPADSAAAPTAQGKAHSEDSAGKQGILTDTQGVDFTFYIEQVVRITQTSWKPLMPREVEAPVRKSGVVKIRYKILRNGHVMDGSMMLEDKSGDVALDRAAWGAVQTSVYPPLPTDFKGPFIELRFAFSYNAEQPPAPTRTMPKPFSLPGPLVTLGYKSKL
jgi:outer membrane biosynthesis protein TonB